MSELGTKLRPLLARVIAGDRSARDRAWACIGPFVEARVLAAWRGASTEDVADLTQDLAMKLLLGDAPALASWNPERPLKPWLATVVANAVRDRVRATRAIELRDAAATREAATEPKGVPTLEAILAEHAELLERELARLSHTDAAIIRGLLTGLTHSEAARRVGRTAKTAQRAVRRLTNAVQSTGDRT